LEVPSLGKQQEELTKGSKFLNRLYGSTRSS